MNPLTPQPGDTWTASYRKGFLKVEQITYDTVITNLKEIPLDLYPKLAQESINQGATLTRADGSTWSKDIETFEV